MRRQALRDEPARQRQASMDENDIRKLLEEVKKGRLPVGGAVEAQRVHDEVLRSMLRCCRRVPSPVP